MGKKKFHAIAGTTEAAELDETGERLGFSATGLVTIDLQRQTVRYPTAAAFTVANQPDNRVDINLTGGTLTLPPGWRGVTY